MEKKDLIAQSYTESDFLALQSFCLAHEIEIDIACETIIKNELTPMSYIQLMMEECTNASTAHTAARSGTTPNSTPDATTTKWREKRLLKEN